MAWADNLRAASFRGVPFKVESHDTSGGRRVVKHEFPLRDRPYVEDMGRRAKEFTIDAYVIGADYMRQRDALMRACDEAGPGELVHPYLGTLRVVCTGWSLRESKSDGRMARFALSFVESGEAEYPSDSFDPLAASNAAADAAKTAAVDDFANTFSVEGLPDFAAEDAKALLAEAGSAINYLARAGNSLTSGQAGFGATVGGFLNSLDSLVTTPRGLAGQFFGLIEGAAALFDAPRDAVRMLSKMFGYGAAIRPVPLTTSTRRTQATNRTAIVQLVRRAAIIEAARQAPAAEYETVEDAQSVRDSIADHLDAQIEDPSASDDVFTSLQGLRTAVVRAVPPENIALPRLVSVTPPTTTPALVLAYDLYEDATREAEIVTRNRVKHPGFVPGSQPLKVLSDA